MTTLFKRTIQLIAGLSITCGSFYLSQSIHADTQAANNSEQAFTSAKVINQQPLTGQNSAVQTTNSLPAHQEVSSALEQANEIKSGQTTSSQVVQQTYQKISDSNSKLNNVIYTDPKDAQRQVNQLSNDTTKNEQPFYGVPILIKGLGQAYKGYPNTEGLPYLINTKYNFTNGFVKKLQDMGFIIVGSTNYPELGLINVTNSNLYGPTHNPWDLTRNPGGSSGGASTSVAAGIVPIATGNDAGGSLRIPASWSGVIGLKPTQGLIIGDSMTPSVVNFAETRSIDDTITLLKGLMNPNHAKKLLQPLPKDLHTIKIAYSLKSPVNTPVSQDAKNAVLKAVAFLRLQGFTVVEANSPVDGIQLMRSYFLGALDDGSVADLLATQRLHRHLNVADVTSKLISPMTYALYEASLKAPKNVSQLFTNELKLVHQQMSAFHTEYPVYLTPTTATVAPLNSDPAFQPEYVDKLLKIKELPFDQQMQLIYDAWLHGLSKTPFTQLANLAGEPALSLPIYVNAAGLPLGIQLEGSKGSDFLLLALGKLFEEHHQFIFLSDYQKDSQPASECSNIRKQIVYTNCQNCSDRNSLIISKVSFYAKAQYYHTKINVSNNLHVAQSNKLPQTGNQTTTLLSIIGLCSLLILMYAVSFYLELI